MGLFHKYRVPSESELQQLKETAHFVHSEEITDLEDLITFSRARYRRKLVIGGLIIALSAAGVLGSFFTERYLYAVIFFVFLVGHLGTALRYRRICQGLAAMTVPLEGTDDTELPALNEDIVRQFINAQFSDEVVWLSLQALGGLLVLMAILLPIFGVNI